MQGFTHARAAAFLDFMIQPLHAEAMSAFALLVNNINDYSCISDATVLPPNMQGFSQWCMTALLLSWCSHVEVCCKALSHKLISNARSNNCSDLGVSNKQGWTELCAHLGISSECRHPMHAKHFWSIV